MNSRVKRSGELLETEVDGELVALDVERGKCYGLNAIGTEIWALLGEETSVAAIRDTLVQRYDIDEATCEQEVTNLLNDLQSAGLISVKA